MSRVFAPLATIGVLLAVVAAFIVAATNVFVGGHGRADAESIGLQRVAHRVHIYALRKKRLPTAEEGLAAVYGADSEPHDTWGRPYVYVLVDPASGRFDLVTYAADGEPGGTGQDEDVRLSDVAPDLTVVKLRP